MRILLLVLTCLLLPGLVFPLAESVVVARNDLLPAEPGTNPERGFAVAADGDWLVMGARLDDEKGEDAGAVYVFRWDADQRLWEPRQKLFADTPQPGAQFGFSVALRGDKLAVGALGEGAVYVFTDFSGYTFFGAIVGQAGPWFQEAWLTGDDPGEFGRAVALDDGRLAVGSVAAHGDKAGAVHLFSGQSWSIYKRLTPVSPVSPQPGERFGSAVSLSGSVLAVGAPGYDVDANQDTGAVYAFLLQPDRPPARLTAPRLQAGDQLGFAVATDGQRILAGAPTADPADVSNAGAIFAFTFDPDANQWHESPEPLPAAGARREDQLGSSLALGGSLLAAGAPGWTFDKRSGAVRVYRRDGLKWVETAGAPLQPDNGEPRDRIGTAVAVNGDRVVAGAPLGDQGGLGAGAAWSFECDFELGCQQEAEAVTPGLISGSRFGISLAATEDFLAVGTLGPGGGTAPGAVHVYRRAGQGWRQEALLTGANVPRGFGRAVALDGDILAVGAPGIAPGNGAVYLFQRHGRTWVPRPGVAPITPGETFGAALALSGGVLAVGEPGNDARAANAGAVHLFRLPEEGPPEPLDFVAATDPQPEARFGEALALRGVRGDILAVGAPGTDNRAGAVYVRNRAGNQWTPSARLSADDGPGSFMELGSAVALGDGLIAAGAPRFLDRSGAVDLFAGSGASWEHIQRLSPGFDPNLYFGASVFLADERLAVGAPGRGNNPIDDNDGAFLFERADEVWQQTLRVNMLQRPFGDGFGTAVALSGDFLVATSPIPPGGDRATIFRLGSAVLAAEEVP